MSRFIDPFEIIPEVVCFTVNSSNQEECSDDDCERCMGTGIITHCVLCEDNVSHGSCDDSYTEDCSCENSPFVEDTYFYIRMRVDMRVGADKTSVYENMEVSVDHPDVLDVCNIEVIGEL